MTSLICGIKNKQKQTTNKIKQKLTHRIREQTLFARGKKDGWMGKKGEGEK